MASAAARQREYAARREIRAGLAAVRAQQPADLLTVAEVAQRLAISPDQVYLLVKADKLSHVRVGIGGKRPRIRFTEADVEAYIARNRKVAAADREYPDVSRVPHRPRRSLAGVEGAQRYA